MTTVAVLCCTLQSCTVQQDFTADTGVREHEIHGTQAHQGGGVGQAIWALSLRYTQL
jgi:hypothetical protein